MEETFDLSAVMDDYWDDSAVLEKMELNDEEGEEKTEHASLAKSERPCS